MRGNLASATSSGPTAPRSGVGGTRELDPALFWTAARSPGVQAVDTRPSPVDVQLAVDQDRVPAVDGHRTPQAEVVVQLECVTGQVADLDPLVPPGVDRFPDHIPTERDFGS